MWDTIKSILRKNKPPEKRDRDNLRKLIREHGFGELEDYLMQHARPSIRVVTERVEDESLIPIGASKVGGRPDLPKDMDWVTVMNREKVISQPFIAQFNLQDLKPYDEENLLPDSGILYFFKGKVIYFTGAESQLKRRFPPEELYLYHGCETHYPCQVSLISEVNLEYEGVWSSFHFTLERWRQYHPLYNSTSYAPTIRKYSHMVNRLLGTSFGVPDMRVDCELMDTFGRDYEVPDGIREEAEQNKHKWQLLFEISSDDNANMMWSDNGYLCYYIRHEDLRNRNFNKVCIEMFSA